MAKVSAINWTNKSVKAFAQDADPFDAIQEAARKLVLNAREKGWQGPPFNPLHIVEMLGVRGEANSSIADLGFVPLSKTGAELLFELISQRYERGSTLITSNLPFEEWTETFGTERLTGALLDRLTHHVNILEMNGESYRLNQSRSRMKSRKQ